METNIIDQAISGKAAAKLHNIKTALPAAVNEGFSSMLNGAIGKSSKIEKPVDKKLMDTCIEMESIFVKQMLSCMKNNIDKGEFLHGGYAENIFEDMLYDEYALNISKNSNMGIAKSLYEELSRTR